MSAAAVAATATAAATAPNVGVASVHTIGGFAYDLDPSLNFPGLVEQYQIPQAAPPSLPEVAPLPAAPTSIPSPGTGGSASRASAVVSSNLLTEVLQSGGKFDPTQFDFSALTLPNTHKANRKKKAGEGDKAAAVAATAAGNKNSSIL